MSHLHRAFLPLVLALALSGCMPNPAEPTSPTAAPIADSGASSEPAGPPTSLVGLGCDELVSLTTIQAALSTEVVARPVAPRPYGPSTALYDVALLQDGGTQCLWSNGDPLDFTEGYEEVRFSILPNAGDVWAATRARLLMTDDEIVLGGGAPVTFGDESVTDCASDDHGYYGTCLFEVLTGEYWLSFAITGVTETAGSGNAGDAIVRAVADAVGARPAPGPQWAPPAGTRPAPSDCAGVLPVADIRSALGEASIDEDFAYDSSPSFLDGASFAQAGAAHCGWRTPVDWIDPSGAGRYVVIFELAVLEGGSWYWDGSAEPPHVAGAVLTPVAGVGDAAWGSCHSAYPECTLHVLKDNTWFVLSSENAVTDLSAVVALAHEVVD